MPSGIKDEFLGISESVGFPRCDSTVEEFTLFHYIHQGIIRYYGSSKEIDEMLLEYQPYLMRTPTNQEYKMLQVIEKTESTHLYFVFLIQIDLLKVLVEKGAYYGKSFCRKGWHSIYNNIQRKFDVIDTALFEKFIKKGDTSSINGAGRHGFIDGLRDLSNYSILGWTYALEKTAEEARNGQEGQEGQEG